MTGDTGLRKGWKRLLVIFCTLLLAGSVLLVFGVMGWAQDSDNEAPQEDTGTEAETQEEGTETGEEVEAISEEQPTAEEEPKGELTIEYWEPQLGERRVWYTNDLMDAHGEVYGTSMLGYWDDFDVYLSTFFPLISIRPDVLDYSDYYYKSVEAISNMNPCYFNEEGPWYFNMTTPWKYIEKVIGIHEAPDAHLYPEATYAVEVLAIFSGGFRINAVQYRSNDAQEQKWYSWGFTREYIPIGDTGPTKEVIHYRRPHDRQVSAPRQILAFPLTIGTTGVEDAVYIEGGGIDELSDSATYEVVGEGDMTVPAGTFDAVMVRYNVSYPPIGREYTTIFHEWVAQSTGGLVGIESLMNIIGPYYEQAIEIYVLEEFTSPGGGGQQ